MDEAFIYKVKQTILEHIEDEKFGANELSSKIGLSSSQLLRRIKNTTGKTVSEFIRDLRLQEAAKLFRQIYDDYPESEFAPMGLFMSGFVLANELNMYNEATENYKLFLEAFPDDKLAASAKEELDNMGLTPEEILQKNLARQE